jgi:hypothetical membrane protein
MGRLGVRTAAWVWLAGAAVYLVCEAIAVASHPGYSYVSDYISDLGASRVMNYGAFMLHGSLFLVGAIIAIRSLPVLGWAGWSFVLAAAANAVGNVLVSLFRSGVSAHTVGAGLAIVGGNVALIIAGLGGRQVGASWGYRKASLVLGVIGIASLLTLIIDGANGTRVLPVGVVERGSVYSIIVWEIMTGVAILSRRRPTWSSGQSGKEGFVR